MNIVYCSDAVIPDRPAHTIHIMKMCEAFSSIGNNVTLLAHDTVSPSVYVDDEYEYYGVAKKFDIVRLGCPKIRGGALIYAKNVLKYIKKKQPDLIYGRSLYSSFVVSQYGKIPFVYEIHTAIEKDGKKAFIFKKVIESQGLRYLVVISEALKSYFVNEWGIKQEKILIAHDAATVSGFSKDIDLFLPENRKDLFIAGYIGHLYKGRGIDIIITIAQRCSDMNFYVVGGNEADVEHWQCVVAEKKIMNIFFTGYVSPADVSGYGKQFDALLAPYQREVLTGTYGKRDNTVHWMSPLKIFEYMSYGKPIVCSDLPALRSILTDKENCVMCQCDNPDEWCQAIYKIKEDKEFAATISKNAREKFEQNYTWEQRAKKVLKL